MIFLVFLLKFSSILRSNAQDLPANEVEALVQIGRKLGIDQLNITDGSGYINPWKPLPDSCNTRNLSFSYGASGSSYVDCDCTFDWKPLPNSCITNSWWFYFGAPGYYFGCNCTFDDSRTCHVTDIKMSSLNLTGELPEDLANLTFLSWIDLSGNYLRGSIPRRWTSLPLVYLNLQGNLIGGTIPRELGNVTTLRNIYLQDNAIGGSLPPELGSLRGLERLVLSGNNFTGVLPDTFGNLRNLTHFRIDGSTLSGKIPEFIGNWTSLIRLVLRNCSIIGQIPSYIGVNLENLRSLDLSFNRFSGPIPESLGQLAYLEYMYLTNNGLSGEVQSWLQDTTSNFDVSYNNFTGHSPSNNCIMNNLNQISSYGAVNDNSIEWCLMKDLPCITNPNNVGLFINSGGPRMLFENRKYDPDENIMGPSSFYSNERWAMSTTGDFPGRARFIASKKAGVPNIYSSARLAPISLKYYGHCLRTGSYKLRLHFAEIMLTADQANNTRGRRIFDVYVQGTKELTDFNIVEEAGGIGIGIVREFPVMVTGGTLEIHLYWSGKGTISTPTTGVYGPLISAIELIANFSSGISNEEGLSAGAIGGIVFGSVGGVLLILAILRKLGYQRGKDLEDNELKGLELQTGFFTLKQIKVATGNFAPANKIGEGGFGPVFKGVLPDGSIIAVKQLSSKSKQGNKEFITEIGMLSAVQNEQLVKLYGCCIESSQLLLIYEYMENNSLANALFGRPEQILNLDWPTRQKICLDIAKGLTYLHEESRIKIVHRDMKATNVLLDKDLNAKISDFGLAKLNDEENTHISTRVAGTVGYMAPEYAMRG